MTIEFSTFGLLVLVIALVAPELLLLPIAIIQVIWGWIFGTNSKGEQ